MRIMFDLFSGLGGASEAFVKSTQWDVYRLENNPIFTDRKSERYVPFTKSWDALNYDKSFFETLWNSAKRKFGLVDFVWASPPCYEFSTAYHAPKAIASREGRLDEYEPDMSLLEATINFIDTVKPKYWAIENVRGACPHFEPYLGKHRIKMGPMYIWGNFPIIGFVEEETNFKKKAGDAARWSDIRANERAKVPLWLSEQMRKAVQYQLMIDDFENSLNDLNWVPDMMAGVNNE